MTGRNEHASESLEDVLDWFHTEGSPHADDVSRWMTRYPMYADEIMHHAATWAMMIAPVPASNAITEDDVEARGIAALQRYHEGTNG